ncbi:histidine triad (HIT) family protein [Thermomonospora echinospora]|uniref:Histidine triad (HIT) family protein n=1 Tax=Thermomonospora echinospora TaxID=1992 RepID=A0A1H6DZM2_9ACTN|nr:HIT domain-containing protein [Thermomonospora echinospora]SEG90105.1 histidine triad (HIT) family protein [Thermomonospora echinospora]
MNVATSSSCVFCRIVEGSEAAEIIYESDRSVAFLDIAQATRGHTLVVPRTHRRDLSDIEVDEAAAVMSAVVWVSNRLTRRLQAPGINLWHASGETAWQSVFHFHIHVVPRYTTADLAKPWTEAESPLESLRGLADHIRRP